MKLSDTPLFYSSLLLFSEESMEKLKGTVVGIVGVGGVGAVAAEMLARTGIETFRIADPDSYEANNINRQLFATHETIGRNKAACAAERLMAINPHCNVTAIEEGIHLSNIYDFCEGVDVLISQGDTPSSVIIIHRVASDLAIPVITGARCSLEQRWLINAKIWNYRKNQKMKRYDEVYHPVMSPIPFEALTEGGLKAYDDEVRRKRNEAFKEQALSNPEGFKSIGPEELRERVAANADAGRRHVCSVLANVAGCLAAASAIRVILGGPESDLQIDLWNDV